MSIQALYISVFSVSRPTRTADGQGGWTVGYSDAGTVQGRLRPASASEKAVAMQMQAQVSHVLYCGASEDLERGDLITCEGRTVEVIAVREPSHMGHHLEIDCLEIQQEPAETGS